MLLLDPRKAMELFQKVITMEKSLQSNDIKWTFKALQHLVILNCQLETYTSMIECYQNMLTYLSTVTRNECTNAINEILDKTGKANDIEVLSKMYEITLEALKSAKNESMWFSTNLKLAKLYLESRKIADVERLLTVHKKSCQLPDGQDDDSKGTYLLEVYCIEIQMCAMLSDSGRLRDIYPKINKYTEKAAVSDPRVMGVIREELGKMFMRENNWSAAYNELNEAFRKYQEVGNARAKDCLKYLVLTSMLAMKDINPFSAKEAKVFMDDKEVQ
jgi:COP9 signalosome complex subunit 2